MGLNTCTTKICKTIELAEVLLHHYHLRAQAKPAKTSYYIFAHNCTLQLYRRGKRTIGIAGLIEAVPEVVHLAFHTYQVIVDGVAEQKSIIGCQLKILSMG